MNDHGGISKAEGKSDFSVETVGSFLSKNDAIRFLHLQSRNDVMRSEK